MRKIPAIVNESVSYKYDFAITSKTCFVLHERNISL